MKRSPMPASTKPMKRSNFLRSRTKAITAAATPAARTGVLGAESFKRVKVMRKSRPKMTPIRKAAKGQECQLQIPGVAFHDPATVVLCHSNRLADGKGMSLKSPDTCASFGCIHCHRILDGQAPRPDGMTHDEVEALFNCGVERTHVILARMGLIEKKEVA